MSILSSTQIPYSIGTATGIRVGNLLGAGEPEKAKKSAFVSLFFASEYTACDFMLNSSTVMVEYF